MMQPMDEVETQSRSEQKAQDRRQRLLIMALAFLVAGLLASTFSLGVIHASHLQSCRTSDPSTPGLSESTQAPPVPQAPPVGRLAFAPAVVRRTSSTTTTTTTSSSSSSSPPPYPLVVPAGDNSTRGPPSQGGDGAGRCAPGSVWGGRMLDGLDHGYYMALMQKALSASPPGVAGEIHDYYHTALRSVFRCGGAAGAGQLQLQVVAACRAGYVAGGEGLVCDGGGSYGNSTAASSDPA